MQHQYPSSLQYQTPPQLPKKTRPKQNFRPIIVHSTLPAQPSSPSIDIQHLRNPKRKSAVELLAESKPYYVKSEITPSQITSRWRRWGTDGGSMIDNSINCQSNDLTILDRKQQVLHQSGRAYSTTKKITHSSTLSPTSCLISPSHTFPHQRAHTLNNRRSAPSNSELLQMKLRRLINDSAQPKENTTFDFYSMTNRNNYCRRPSFDLEDTKFEPPKQFSTPKCLNQELTIQAANDSDTDVMFPSAFLSPQSLPSHNTTLCDDDIYTYCDDKNDYQPISPPAEYAEFSSSPVIQKPPRKKENRSNNYQRSYSHSHTAEIEEPDYASPTNTTTNHKSLPDLHTQTNRNSPYSEYSESRGNRSNKSNSSLNRDSGGSSGHYTHRSEPYCKQEPYTKYQTQSQYQKPQYNHQQHPKYYGPDNRRDSGSSTQHSGNSYYNIYSGAASRHDYIECDNNQSPIDENCLLNFTTSVVPEAFQDRFSDDENDQQQQQQRQQQQHKYNEARQAIYRNERTYYGNKTDCYEPYSSTITNKCLNGEGELSPPLGTFKRQRCLRLKQHPTRHPSPSDRVAAVCDERKPILRSKSDISHRYFSRNVQKDNTIYLNEINSPIGDHQRIKSENLSELERFFDRLGLPDDLYNEYIVNNSSESNRSSPVFFSDVPTVDSDQLPDSTETQLETQPYRPIEPTSIVERNARIIKWLCTCRKMQVT